MELKFNRQINLPVLSKIIDLTLGVITLFLFTGFLMFTAFFMIYTYDVKKIDKCIENKSVVCLWDISQTSEIFNYEKIIDRLPDDLRDSFQSYYITQSSLNKKQEW